MIGAKLTNARARAAAPPICKINLRIYSSLLSVVLESFHDHFPMHPRFIMAGDETGELEFSRRRKFPQELSLIEYGNALRIRVMVLHFREFLHERGVLLVFSHGCKHELMAFRALVEQ